MDWVGGKWEESRRSWERKNHGQNTLYKKSTFKEKQEKDWCLESERQTKIMCVGFSKSHSYVYLYGILYYLIFLC